MTDRADPGLRERLEQEAKYYDDTAAAILGGGSEWAGAQHYLDGATLMLEAAATLARVEGLVIEIEAQPPLYSRWVADELRRALRPSAEGDNQNGRDT